ncbi:MAG: ABC transporter ATP-binding protein [Coprobacillaceae bacterium]
MIRLEKINKEYSVGNRTDIVLREINMKILPGEYIVLVGKSGSGKSTLLNIISGIDRATSGEVVINDTNISDLKEEPLASWRGKNIGIIFQFFQLIPTLSVLENILLAMNLVGIVSKEERENRAKVLLETVGLQNHMHKMPSTLSGGEQQRVAIARALANDVDIIIADEPTGNLDTKNAEEIFSLLRTLHQQGKTIIMVTHEKENIKGASRKITLQDGRIIEDTILYKEESV